MLESMLLFLEIILLVATAAIYWATRRLVAKARTDQADLPFSKKGREQGHTAQMVRDVTELVSELQTVASAAREDLSHQRLGLEKTLAEAETSARELRDLLNQAEILSVSQVTIH
ncbi:MAG: hypothetical protein AB1801_02115, partial [Chloroflexota bacterium]